MTKLFFYTSRLIIILITLFQTTKFIVYAKDNDYRIIDTDNFELIYKEEIEEEAQKLANFLEYLYSIIGKTLKTRPPKYKILLDNDNLTANGSTGSENIHLYTWPTSDSYFVGGCDWLKFLTIHELRHGAQNAYEFKGIKKILYFIGGGVLLSNYSTMYSKVPSWLAEGDAVCTETGLTHYGRLSYPLFLLPFKAMILEGPEFNYHQGFNRSYLDNIPNPYSFGALINCHLRRNYDPDIIANIYNRLSKEPFPFHLAVYKETKKSLNQIFTDAKLELKNLWEKQLESITLTESEPINSTDDTLFADYIHAYESTPGKIIALKYSKNNQHKFIEIDLKTKKEKILFGVPNILSRTFRFSINEKSLIWLTQETESSSLDEFADIIKAISIVVYDQKLKKHKKIAKGRFLDCSISPDSNFIVVVEFDKKNQKSLVILDAKTGVEIKRFKNPNNKRYMSPIFSENGEYIYSVVSNDEKMSLEAINVKTEEEEEIISPRVEVFHSIYQYKDYIYYSSAYSGIDNIYAVNINSKEIFQVTSKKYGAYAPSVSLDGTHLYFSNYTKYGLDIDVMAIDKNKWIPIEKVKNVDINYHLPIRKQEDCIIKDSEIPKKVFESKRHYLIKDLISFNAWMVDILSGISNDPYYAKVVTKMQDIHDICINLTDVMYYLKPKILVLENNFNLNATYPNIKFTIRKQLLNANSDTENNQISDMYEGALFFPIDANMITYKAKFTPYIKFGYDYMINKNNKTDLEMYNDGIKPKIGIHIDIFNPTIGNYQPLEAPFMLQFESEYRYIDNIVTYKNLPNNQDSKKIRGNGYLWYAKSKALINGFASADSFEAMSIYQYKSKIKNFRNEISFGTKIQNCGSVQILENDIYEFYEGNLLGLGLSYNFPIAYPDTGIPYILYIKYIGGTIISEFVYLPDVDLAEDKAFHKNQKSLALGGSIFCYSNSLSTEHKYGDAKRSWVVKLDLKYKYFPFGYQDSNLNFKHKFSFTLSIGSISKEIDFIDNKKTPINPIEDTNENLSQYKPGYQE